MLLCYKGISRLYQNAFRSIVRIQLRLLFAILLLGLISKPLSAQDNWRRTIDSMQRLLLLHPKQDSIQVELLINTGGQFEANQPDSAIYYYKQAEAVSNKMNYTRGKLRYLACMVELFETQAKFDTAILMAKKAVAIAEKSKSANFIAGAYNNIASLYDDLGKGEEALLHYQKAMVIYEQLQAKWKLGIVYGNMLAVYVAIEEKEKAHEFGIKAIKTSREGNNPMGEAVGLENLAALLIKMKRYDTAMLLSQQELVIGKTLNDKTYQHHALGNINSILLARNEPDKVLANAETMEQLALEIDYKEGIAVAEYQKGVYFFKRKAYKQALIVTQNALQILLDNKIKTNIVKQAHQQLSDIGLVLGNTSLYEKERIIADSITEANTQSKILKYNQQLQAEYAVNKKQVEIQRLQEEQQITKLTLQKRNIAIGILIGSLLAISLLVYLYYRYTKQKNKLLQIEDDLKAQHIKELEQAQQLLATESLVQGQEQERHRLAKDLHDGLGSILSSTKYSFSNMKNNLIITEDNLLAFEKSMAMLDKSISELRRVAHNMMPEALLKLGLDAALQDFCSGVAQSGALKLVYQSFEMETPIIPINKASIIYRVIQELVNNIIKHAEATNALVQIIKKEEGVHITVEDDGKGFDINILSTNTGIGYTNLQSRIAYLNGSVDIQTDYGKGTSIYIDIPNIAA